MTVKLYLLLLFVLWFIDTFVKLSKERKEVKRLYECSNDYFYETIRLKGELESLKNELGYASRAKFNAIKELNKEFKCTEKK